MDIGGYLKVKLYKGGVGKEVFIHRLVAEAFIPNPENKTQVNHKDEIKIHNYVANLEWATAKENVNYGTRNARVAKKELNHPSKSVAILCIETGVIYPSMNEAERQTGINRKNIGSVCCGRRKTAGGYHWKYAEEGDAQ